MANTSTGKSAFLSKLQKGNKGIEVVNGKLIPKGVIGVLEQYGVSIVDTLTEKLEKKKKNSTGSLSDSIQFNYEETQYGFDWYLEMAKHWKWVDKGRGKGKVPSNVIYKWLNEQRVQTKFKALKGFGKKKSLRELTAKQKKGLAYVISRSIEKKGYKGSNFYSSTITTAWINRFTNDIRKASISDVEVMVTDLSKIENGNK